MDKNDIIIRSMILHGCELARRLEANLPSMLNNSDSALSEWCTEIIRAFMGAQEKLTDHQASQFSQQFSVFGQDMSMIMERHEHDLAARISIMFAGQDQVLDAVVMGAEISRTDEGSGNFETGQSSKSSRPESSSTRPRRRLWSDRRERDGRRTVRVAAPRIGNTEIPPEDGFTWRKYGQKEILGSRFPRAYFRCTHQKLYNCPAKKQVQRLDDNPDNFEVTYRNDHTCHTSATAPGPSVLIRPLPIIPNIELATTAALVLNSTPTTNARTTWLSMGGSRPILDPNPFVDHRALSYGSEYNYHRPVIEMADTMFNSEGRSNNTSMDQIFSSSVEDRWNHGGDVSGKKQSSALS